MKRLVTLLLAVIMLVTCVPTYAMATGTETLDESELSATIAEETTEPVVEEATEPAVEETTEPVVEETTEPVVEETTEPVAEEATEPAVEETTEPTNGETAEPVVEETDEIVLKENSIARDVTNTVLPSDLKYKVKDGEVTITGYSGYAAELEIPDTLYGMPVTRIDYGAFFECESLTSVTIPYGVITIGESAFSNCENLTTVSIPNSVTFIGKNAFYWCSSLTSIVIPDSVTYIGNFIFWNCSSLKSVTIGNGLPNIGDEMFYDCTNLEHVTIGSKVTSIGKAAFRNCSSLTSITLPKGVIKIGESAFADCSNLNKIELGDKVTTIGKYAFKNCESLTSIILPNSVTDIGDGIFMYCSNLPSITIPNGITSIGESTFQGCRNLTSVVIPNTITSIGEYAFEHCSKLTSITIPAGVTSIGKCAFAYCSKLASINIPNSVTSINYATFKECGNLAQVTIGSGVTSIASNAFYFCSSLTNIIIPDGVTRIGESAFYYCSSLLSITIPASVTTIERYAFQYCNRLEIVYYTGTGAQKANITIGVQNFALNGAAWYCNYEPLAITKQPKSVCVKAGETAKVTVKATGEGLTYKWYYKKPGASKFSASSTFTKGTYYVKDMDASKSGWKVYCKITDSYGNSVKTNTVTLNIPATITKQPVSVGVENGTKAKVTVEAVGKGLTYEWYYKKPGAKNFYKSTTTKSTYSITMSNSNDGRQVYCVVTDSYGNRELSKTVTLNKAVTITTQPKDKTVNEGETAKITVKATGTGLTYKWYYKKPGAKKFYASSSFTKGTYYIKDMSSAKSGWQAYCVITDAYGNKVTTKTVTLSVNKIYLNRYGSKYHYDQECAGKTAYESTLSQALEKGKTPCSTCVH